MKQDVVKAKAERLRLREMRKMISEMRPKVMGPDPVGWKLTDWLAAVSISKITEFRLPEQIRPRSVRIGRRRIITEAPVEWLRRVSRAGGSKTNRDGQ